ncbi:hypothetical protein CONCODRAFT_7697 [Conidiobolus coronatus NRRL 28638]|uniref:Uncharacterized protein n=1 Tax=Conidiobolus coronatus (strain ATCC 28846 / CBS 209.66 / NRRL 28638) TaxID=796925 RepID=A0A137P455_CONC2|nr:hypothetical protein CONCODRAFT_7697 [Conidiobolus coronatus NRRL 28638]|eukprot:KXN69808.1 hypothetical protein CONCODRAFT_7697 [Conidiobolus coronatus NRRL 28638]
MKFTALFAAVTSAVPLLAPSNPYSYYRANDVDIRIRADANIALNVGRYCNRGAYGGYDAYRCTRSINGLLDLRLSINLDLGLVFYIIF